MNNFNIKTKKMRILLISLLLTSFVACGNSQENNNDFTEFYKANKNTEGVVAFELPMFLAKMVIDKDEEELKEFMKKTDDIRFFISDKSNTTLYRKLENHLSPNVYNDLMIIKEGGSTVTFKIRENKNKIREILLTVVEDSSFVAISFTGEFTIEDAKKMAKSVKTDGLGDISL